MGWCVAGVGAVQGGGEQAGKFKEAEAANDDMINGASKEINDAAAVSQEAVNAGHTVVGAVFGGGGVEVAGAFTIPGAIIV